MRGRRFPVSELASAHVLAHRRRSRPLLLHVWNGKESQRWAWTPDRSPLACLLDELRVHGAARLRMLIVRIGDESKSFGLLGPDLIR